MRGMLSFLGRHAGIVLAMGIGLGIVFPALARIAAPLLVPSIVLLLAIALARLDAPEVLTLARRPILLIAIFAWLLALAPAGAAALASVLDVPDKLRTAIVLSAACPPVMSAIAFALMFRLDAALASIVVIGTVFLVPLSLPPLALLLLGLKLDIDVPELMIRLAAIVLAALGLAAMVRVLVPRAKLQNHSQMLDGIAVVMLLIFAVAIMDGVAAAITERPAYVGLTLLAAFLANAGLQLAAAALFAPLGRSRALTLALVSGNRNMGLLLAALGPAADFDIVLYLALGQIPVYLTPLCRPLYLWASRSRCASRRSMPS